MNLTNKLERLIDESTILNIPLMFQLVFRYKYLSILAIVSCLSVCHHLYNKQVEVYWSSIRFSNLKEKSNSPMDAISVALGSDTNERGYSSSLAEEVKGLRVSMDFTRDIAHKVMKHDYFFNMNFNPTNNKSEEYLVSSLITKCEKNRECVLEELVGLIPGFYSINDPERTGLNFVLEVGTADKKTTQVLLKLISEAISESRVDSIRLTYTDQRKSAEQLVEKEKKRLEDENYLSLTKSKEILKNDIDNLQYEIQINNKLSWENKSLLSIAEAKVKKSNKMISSQIDNKELNKDKKRNFLKEKIENMRKDINALEMLRISHSTKEIEILDSLKSELKKSEMDLKNLGNSRSLASLNEFVNKTQDSVEESEFNYDVYKKYSEKAKTNYRDLLAKNSSLVDQLLFTKNKLEKLRPIVEFLKALESKVIQLKLLEITSTSDLKFDNFATFPVKSKKISKLMIFVYSFFFIVFSMLGVLCIRFITDDNIYDESDLNRIFPDVEVLGVSPKFEE
jgi:hypothetical protein